MIMFVMFIFVIDLIQMSTDNFGIGLKFMLSSHLICF